MAADEPTRVLEERNRTLEDALRPLLADGHAPEEFVVRTVLGPSNGTSICRFCQASWPCKYETARRALEGE